MNKTKWSKLRSPHGAYNLLGADKAPKGKARKTLTLLLWGGACSPRRVQGRVAVKVRTDRRRRDKHTDVIHCYRWNGCLSQIIDDKHLTRRREETKPGEVKGGKPKTHKKKERERHTHKNCWFLDQAESRTRNLKSELPWSSQSKPTHSCCIKFQN